MLEQEERHGADAAKGKIETEMSRNVKQPI
jgi:hypothetical protein